MFRSIFNDWVALKAMTPQMADTVDYHLTDVMDEALNEVDGFLNQKDPHNALCSMMDMTSLIQAAANVQPKIVSNLAGWVQRVQTSLNKLGRHFGANSITISFPWGVGLSWPIT